MVRKGLPSLATNPSDVQRSMKSRIGSRLLTDFMNQP